MVLLTERLARQSTFQLLVSHNIKMHVSGDLHEYCFPSSGCGHVALVNVVWFIVVEITFALNQYILGRICSALQPLCKISCFLEEPGPCV